MLSRKIDASVAESRRETRAAITELRGEISQARDELREELRDEIAALRQELRREIRTAIGLVRDAIRMLRKESNRRGEGFDERLRRVEQVTAGLTGHPAARAADG